MCYHCYYLFHHSLNWSFFVLSISRVQTMHLGHQSLKSIILFIRQAPFWGFAQIPCASDTFFMSSTILLFSVPSAPTTTGIATVFICHILCISCLGTCTCFSSPFLSERCSFFDGTVISISLQVEFTGSVTTISDMFAVMVQSVLTGMSHMIVTLLSLLCITVSGSCWYHLSVVSISWS